MHTAKSWSLVLLCAVLSPSACHRIADDNEVPEWLFDVFSDVPITADGSSGVSRYTLYEDHRVELDIGFSCGGQRTTWELHWEERGPNELTLRQVLESEDFLPGSGLYSEWVFGYSGECDPIKLYGIRKADGVRNDVGQLYRGSVCNAQIPQPDDVIGQWDECEWFWCDMPPVENCVP
jgi:hypothetical protein